MDSKPRTGFYIDGCATVRTVVLRRAIYKRKKGLRPLVSALSTTPWSYLKKPSRDTVPLSANSLEITFYIGILSQKQVCIFLIYVNSASFDVCQEWVLGKFFDLY
jgi:hypothetical protein